MEMQHATNFKDFTEFLVTWGNQPIDINSLGPNLWISHDWEYIYASVGHRYLKRNGPHNGLHGLVTVFLCMKIAIDKMQLCSLSVDYTCPYQNPTATRGHSVHNVDISKPGGQLDLLPNSLKWCWRRLTVEKLTLNYLATALVDIPAISMPIASSLKTLDICGIVLCNKTAHLRVAFYCPPAQGAPV
jgi:hypothetical protein